MAKVRLARGGVSSDAGKAKENGSHFIIDREKFPTVHNENEQYDGYWKLYTIHFPNNKKIACTRVLSRFEDSWVVAVTDLAKKEGLAIAECKLERRKYGHVFVTRHTHHGHSELCHWMKRRRIGGNYLEYLKALEEECDEEVLEELGEDADISFVLQETDATPDEWTIYRIVEEDGKENLITL